VVLMADQLAEVRVVMLAPRRRLKAEPLELLFERRLRLDGHGEGGRGAATGEVWPVEGWREWRQRRVGGGRQLGRRVVAKAVDAGFLLHLCQNVPLQQVVEQVGAGLDVLAHPLAHRAALVAVARCRALQLLVERGVGVGAAPAGLRRGRQVGGDEGGGVVVAVGAIGRGVPPTIGPVGADRAAAG
jgi:hypothetical protein